MFLTAIIMKNRLARLRNFLRSENLSGVIVSKPENRRYFSGFTGSAGTLLIAENHNYLLTDFRYIEQAKKQADQFEVIQYGNHLFSEIYRLASELNLHNIGFESDFITFDVYNSLQKTLKSQKLFAVKIDDLRMIKSRQELSLISKAVDIADKAFTQILQVLKPGIREVDVAVELEYQMRKLGAEKSAFDIIAASGERGALPHGVASAKVIQAGELVTLDFGAVYDGYHSDITRTVSVGRASKRQRKIYDIVLEAQLEGVRAVRAGRTGKEVDAQSRNFIAGLGYGAYFGHGLGHGVGLAIHEEPRLSPLSGNILLEEGMVVTVEPGIYIPDWGGVRIEDTVVVTATGCQVLTASNKQLIEIDL